MTPSVSAPALRFPAPVIEARSSTVGGPAGTRTRARTRTRRVAAGDGAADVTIPVILDAIRNFDDVPMARCVYVAVETDDTSTGWSLDLARARIPFVMAGITAVLHRGIRGEERFDQPATIEALYRAIEAEPTLSIQTSDLWLPVHTLAGSEEISTLARGHVFRVGFPLFALARRFVAERLSQDDYLEAARNLAGTVAPSPSETEAFRRWNEDQIAYARSVYPKSRELELRWTGPDSGPAPRKEAP
jgi:hypothetical protein